MTFIHKKKKTFIKNVDSKRTHRWPTWPCLQPNYVQHCRKYSKTLTDVFIVTELSFIWGNFASVLPE